MSYLVDDNSKLYFKDYPISKINQLAKESKIREILYHINVIFRALKTFLANKKLKL